MPTLTETFLYALKTFKLAIAVDIGDKVIMLNPRILENLSLEDVAQALSASDLKDSEILKALEVIDTARKPAFPDKKP